MANELGRKLLGEVEVGVCFGDLLTSIQQQFVEVPQIFGIPSVDALLQPLAKFSSGPLDPESPLKKETKSMLEIVDTRTGSGKTHILYHMITLSTLPPNHSNVSLNGKHSAVLLFDVDGRFDARRQGEVMEAYIRSCCQPSRNLSDEEVSTLVREAMMHIHVYRPQSTDELDAMLAKAADYLLTPAHHHFGARRLDAILIDSLSACYWQDKFLELEDTLEVNQNKKRLRDCYRRITENLHSLRSRTGAFAAVTTWGVPRRRDSRGEHADMPGSLLPHSWNGGSSIRVVLSKCPGPAPFPPTISLEEALARKSEHTLGILEAGFLGRFDLRSLPPEIREIAENSEGHFRYRIDKEGIKFVPVSAEM